MGAIIVTSAALCLPFGAAWAQPSGNFLDRSKESSGSRDGGTLAAGASFRGVVIEGDTGGGGQMSPVMTTWEPPACYFAPKWTAPEFKAWWTGHVLPMAGNMESAEFTSELTREHKKLYGPDGRYEDHNVARADEGTWWGVYINPNARGTQEAMACYLDESYIWVEHSDPPPPGPGVPDAAMLAELAYEHVDIPGLSFEVSPAADAQKVNLATWVWLPASELGSVSVTARLDGYASLSSTVTARPVSVSLDAGTADATVHAGSGGCAVSSAGVIGAEWTSARKGETPPCGVTYHRATHGGGGYELSATVTWEVSWEGSDGSGGDLPSGEFGSSLPVQVQEVQTIVR
ncbi:hypothetical protein [Streptomyces spiramenti]|uniref:Secreted protein n=1 Tax=Streptomyces spiramenti TaxID=2720606 RepID=A0ABX1AGG4_9ACTN|nr:hypothetical protein [Streptomyces spiramenti]NJP65056.1 hypothetical protein [Streptomyces spiramenti]